MTKASELLILGSMALDDIATPYGKYDNLLGGSAVYASFAASFFLSPGIISVIGTDFPPAYRTLLEKKKIDLRGVQVTGKTFHWQGTYQGDMSAAQTLATDLNCLETFQPKIPVEHKNAKYIFLANTHPRQQMQMLQQLTKPELIAMDTMNLWINHTREELLTVIKEVDILILNDAEARILFDSVNLVHTASKALEFSLKLKYIIIKKGEHGALMYGRNSHFSAPGYPLEVIKDPTGCGDCFGGGLTGYLAGTKDFSERNMRRAVIYGSICASFNAEDFSLNRLKSITKKDIESRYKEFEEIRQF